MKSGNPNFLEPSGPLQACNGTDTNMQGEQNIKICQYECFFKDDLPI